MASEPTEASMDCDVGEPTYRAKFRRLERLVTLLAQGAITSVFCSGAPGISKSTTVLRTLTGLGFIEGKDFVVCRGHTSALGMFSQLQTSQIAGCAITVWDDCDSALDKAGICILRAALDSQPKRVVSFVSSRLPNGLDQNFEFVGRVIFVSNLAIEQIDSAIESRCHTITLDLNRDEICEFISREVVPQPYLNTTPQQRGYVLHRMRVALAKSAVPVSVRLYRKILDLWCHDREFFNQHLDALAPRSDEIALIRRLEERYDTVGEAAKKYAEITKKSERSYYLAKARHRGAL